MRSQENEEIPEEDEDLEHEVDEAGASSLHDSFHFHQLGLSPADEGKPENGRSISYDSKNKLHIEHFTTGPISSNTKSNYYYSFITFSVKEK